MKKKMFLLAAFVAVCQMWGWAQVTAPKAGARYQVMNAEGVVLANSNGYCVVTNADKTDKNQSWVFEPAKDAGCYYMKNVGTSQYLFLCTWNGWNMQFDAALPGGVYLVRSGRQTVKVAVK